MSSADDAPPPASSLEPADQESDLVQLKAAAFAGPLPPPFILRQYDEILPGAADRIISIAETQQQHRQTLEKRVILGNVDAQSRGQWMGFILGLTGLVGGFVLIGLGRSALGITSVLGSLASLVAIFVVGRWRQEQERARKRDVEAEELQQPDLFSDSDT